MRRILACEDPRLLVVVGPCSVHDTEATLDYARRLQRVKRQVERQMVVLMRVYFEKPRTTLGWKGLINDPRLDGSNDIEAGLKLAREILLAVNELGMPAATEFLDPIVPQYTADLVSWAAVGARTTESQTHREMASGLSMPVGFKNSTDGSLQVALDAMMSARHAHSFLGVDNDGATALVNSRGNPWGHVVLRGGRGHTNFHEEAIREAAVKLAAAGLPPALMVDCSHANSGKKHERQEVVWQSLIEQKVKGSPALIGAMIESFIEAGSQPFPQPVKDLEYGVSITDPCINWETTERLLLTGAEALANAPKRQADPVTASA
ncbi:MAG: 3-deoxy-7-phosphoheptulonate synthase [Verrucomicrobia bacterium]|nr:3-deoxy-7-phosphoheptulonate synthase [Verrucomicrobiota bacterium]